MVAVALIGASLVSVMATGGWSAPKPKATKVAAALSEFKIKPKPKSPKSGAAAFVAKNVGGIKHEMVLVRVSGPDAALPLKPDGSVDESQIPATDKLGEVAGIKPKQTKTLKVPDLGPGTYELFCNIVTKQPGGTVLSHYAKGMHTQITVS